MVKKIILLFILSLSIKGVSFIKELIIAREFGISADLDIVFLALSLFGTVTTVLSSAIQSAVIPKYCNNADRASLFDSGYVLNSVIIIGLITCFFYSIGIDFVVSFFSNQYEVELQEDLKYYLNILVLYTLFQLIASYFFALLRAKELYYTNSFFNLVSPLILIVYILFFDGDVEVIIYSYLISSIVTLLLLLLLFFKPKNKILSLVGRFRIDKSIFREIQPLFYSGMVISGIGLVDQYFLAKYPGFVSVYNYALKVPTLVEGLLISTIITIAFTTVSKNNSTGKHNNNFKLLLSCVFFSVFILCPVSIFHSVYSEDIVKLLYLRGEFNAENVSLVASFQSILAFKVVFSFLSIMAARYMNAYGLNREMLKINFFTFFINGSLNFVLVGYFGPLGVVISTLVVFLLAAFLNFYVVVKRIKSEMGFVS
ncbi:lipid II flippase MurJ [Vibrio splendidus]